VKSYLTKPSVNGSQHIIIAEGVPPLLQHRARDPSHIPLRGQNFHPAVSSNILQGIRINKVPAHHKSTFDRGRNKVFVYTRKHLQEASHLRGKLADVICSRRLTLRLRRSQTFDTLDIKHIQCMQPRQVLDKCNLNIIVLIQNTIVAHL
jgi:hypothetical protein